MSAVFIITLFCLAAIAYTVYRRQRQLGSHRGEVGELGPVRPRSLFDDGPGSAARLPGPPADPGRPDAEHSARLHGRAQAGDCQVLIEAHQAGDASLYASLLAELTRWAAASDDNLRELASFVATDRELRASAALSDAYIELWKQSPDLKTTARMLHLAALSDDADAFGRAVEAAVSASRAGRLPRIAPADLRALIESEFWVLTSDARVTGAGFVLKERLARLREELAY